MNSYTCPRCGSVSWNPSDAQYQYCGRCNAFMGDWTPVPKPQRRERHTAHTHWISTLPCLVCGRQPPSDPHHVRSFGAGGTERDCVPLCRNCHTQYHALGRFTFEQKTFLNLQAWADVLWGRSPFGASYVGVEDQLLDEIDYLPTEDPPPPGEDDGSLFDAHNSHG